MDWVGSAFVGRTDKIHHRAVRKVVPMAATVVVKIA
jgi:hypothetical protein